MYQIINTEVEKYLKSLPDIEDPVMRKMEEYAAKNDFPIIGREGGKLLYLITKIKNPSLVVEMGSGFGYSGYFFAKALKKGKVVLIDYLDRNINLAKDFFKEGNLLDKAQFRVGDAVQIGQEYKNIDILFLDLEKVRYLEAIQILEKNLSEDGIIIADNVLYQGKVVFEKEDRKAKVLDSFNRYMFENYFSVILPIRDGILLGVKK
ncbi:methyltransferase domain-containing protein [Persephonella atlantica]|uniref:Methyltransferase domain-containing protein n=1 Tax=Persephonella atlantica TaxID=2699429 RepID=A0ABS1GFZ3_9AQUI|nr:methyltransferase domain-containing protein [Persephonella atlantica]MBK3331844.1 methyltransferase domain-containing protein [Persephonella atlantica]